MEATRELSVLVSGGSYFEAPRWHDGTWWVSDFYRRHVSRVTAAGDERVVTVVDKQPSGLGWLPDGSLVIASMLDRRLLRFAAGKLTQLADLSGHCGGPLNDLVVDRGGHVFVGDFGADLEAGEAPRPASVKRVNPDGEVSVAAENLNFPNGTVITPDGGTLIVGETMGNRYTAFDLSADGTLSNRRVWAQLGPEVGDPVDFTQLRVGPDGCALDADGCIWMADAFGGPVLRVAPGGEILERVTPPAGLGAFACALGGDDGRTLLLCCAPDALGRGRAPVREALLVTTTVDVPMAE